MMHNHYSKYHAHACVVDGERFDSKGEANRYLELKLLERVGQIEGLTRQPSFELIVNEILICTFRGDFRYTERNRPGEIVEDFKGFYTRESKLKHKLFVALFPQIELRVIDRKGINHAPRISKSISRKNIRKLKGNSSGSL